ncbi:MAG: hypothetical protein M1438_12520 [Deltaproteobacteria bacterium]|nr:hypothetical protein [Deltaproteobacteria bacterium]
MVLQLWDGECERCGEATESPHVHHVYGLNYQIYEILCPDCHAEHHGNDEIADYRSHDPHCKICGKTCSWKKNENRWKLTDTDGKVHVCKHLKEEAKKISESLTNNKRKIQKSLF